MQIDLIISVIDLIFYSSTRLFSIYNKFYPTRTVFLAGRPHFQILRLKNTYKKSILYNGPKWIFALNYCSFTYKYKSLTFSRSRINNCTSSLLKRIGN